VANVEQETGLMCIVFVQFQMPCHGSGG